MNLRIVAEEVTPDITVKESYIVKDSEPSSLAIKGRTTLIYQDKQYEDSVVWDRSHLVYGNVLHGPCVINEMDSNTLILPSYKGEVDSVGNILLWESEGRSGDQCTANDSMIGSEDKDFTLDMVTGQWYSCF